MEDKFTLSWHEAIDYIFKNGGYIQGEKFDKNVYATISTDETLVYYEIGMLSIHRFRGRPFITSEIINQKYRLFTDGITRALLK